MERWMWLVYYLLGSWYGWAILAAVLAGVGTPFLRAVRLWQAKSRFIRSQGAKLENSQNADARFQLANIYAEGGSWRKALVYARDAVKVAGENPLYEGQIPYHMLRLLGDCCSRRRLYDEAVEAYGRALGTKSELGYGDARFGMGLALYRKGHVAPAFDVLNQSIEDNGSNLEGYFRLAQAATDLGRIKEAGKVKREFWRVSRQLPSFAGKRRFRWGMAFLLFPIARRVL